MKSSRGCRNSTRKHDEGMQQQISSRRAESRNPWTKVDQMIDSDAISASRPKRNVHKKRYFSPDDHLSHCCLAERKTHSQAHSSAGWAVLPLFPRNQTFQLVINIQDLPQSKHMIHIFHLLQFHWGIPSICLYRNNQHYTESERYATLQKRKRSSPSRWRKQLRTNLTIRTTSTHDRFFEVRMDVMLPRILKRSLGLLTSYFSKPSVCLPRFQYHYLRFSSLESLSGVWKCLDDYFTNSEGCFQRVERRAGILRNPQPTLSWQQFLSVKFYYFSLNLLFYFIFILFDISRPWASELTYPSLSSRSLLYPVQVLTIT
jgi:hypothetical protein